MSVIFDQTPLFNMRRSQQAVWWLTVFIVFFCGPLAAQIPLPVTEFVPVVDGTPEQRSTPFVAWIMDLSQDGYVEEEFLVSGLANIYDYVDEAARSPVVAVSSSDLGYTTRLLVRRPKAGENFNGTVYVEVLNPTFFYDVDFIWEFTFESIIDEGAAYVGVTSKPVAADFLRDDWGTSLDGQPLPQRNNSRYATISMPEFGQVWDVLTQVGALLKTDGNPDNPLAGFGVQRLILVGYSQSAGYQVTYINSFHADASMPGGSPVFDGYYIGAGSFGAKRVNPSNPNAESHPAGDPRNLLASPVPAPVFRFQTQSEMLPFFNADTTRQTEADDPMVRSYEMAGGTHLDLDNDELGGQFLQRDLGLESWHGDCELPMSPIRNSPVQSALLRAIETWIRDGTQPPASRLIQIGRDDNGQRIIDVDANGNAIGGVRSPTIEVPLGTYLGHNPPLSCYLNGAFIEFDEQTLSRLYPTKLYYVQQVERAVIRAIAEGFLLPEDGQQFIDEAYRQALGGGDGGGGFGLVGILLLVFAAIGRYRRRSRSSNRLG